MTKVTQGLQQTTAKPKFSSVISSDAYKKLINNTLSDPKRVVRFVATLTSAVATIPKLQTCDHNTIISSALVGESLNLSIAPGLGQFYLIPFEDRRNNRTVCTAQIGVNGYKQLAMRTGQYLDIDAIEVRKGEYKGRDKFTGKPTFEFVSDDDVREELPIIGYLAYFELLNGFKKSIYFSQEKMLKHADKYSQAFSREAYEKILAGKMDASEMWKYKSPWYDSFTGQSLKTVLKQLLSKWGILSTELVDAIRADQGVPVVEDGNIVSVEYVDHSPEEETTVGTGNNTIEVEPDTDDPLA